jgi:hypothetical protein
VNDVVKNARTYREKRGNWGSHAEALCNEVERLEEALRLQKVDVEHYKSVSMDHALLITDLYKEVECLNDIIDDLEESLPGYD